jgi:hypothetical protein
MGQYYRVTIAKARFGVPTNGTTMLPIDDTLFKDALGLSLD